MNIKEEVEKANEWNLKWCRHFKSKIKPPKLSIHYRQQFDNGPIVATTYYRKSLTNYCKPQIKIHLYPVYFDLTETFKEETIKHEVCHFVDIIENGYKKVSKDFHGDRFQSYLKPINGILSVPFDAFTFKVPNLSVSLNSKYFRVANLKRFINKERSICSLENSVS